MEPKTNNPAQLETRYRGMMSTHGRDHMLALIQGKTDGIDDAEKQIAELQAQVEAWRAQRAALVRVVSATARAARR